MAAHAAAAAVAAGAASPGQPDPHSVNMHVIAAILAGNTLNVPHERRVSITPADKLKQRKKDYFGSHKGFKYAKAVDPLDAEIRRDSSAAMQLPHLDLAKAKTRLFLDIASPVASARGRLTLEALPVSVVQAAFERASHDILVAPAVPETVGPADSSEFTTPPQSITLSPLQKRPRSPPPAAVSPPKKAIGLDNPSKLDIDQFRVALPEKGPSKPFRLEDVEDAEVVELPYEPGVLTDQLVHSVATLCHRATTIILRHCEGLKLSYVRNFSLYMGKRLLEIDFSGSTITDAGIKALAVGCSTLQTIRLAGCQHITNQAIQFAVAGLGDSLTSMDLSGCTQIDREGLYWFAGGRGKRARSAEKMRSLNLTGCIKLDGLGVEWMATSCFEMEYLGLGGCVNILPQRLANLILVSKHLRVLDLHDCVQMNDDVLLAIARTCPHIRSLNFSRCDVSDTGMVPVAQGCPHLSVAVLSYCEKITTITVSMLAKHCPKLQMLDVSGCCDVLESAIVSAAFGLRYAEVAQSYFGLCPHPRRASFFQEDMKAHVRNAAALIIQCMARIILARRVLRIRRRRHYAAMRIQRFLRSRKARTQFSAVTAAAVENVRRRKETRKRIDRILRARAQAARVAVRRRRAAIMIQSAIRGWYTRAKSHAHVRQYILYREHDRQLQLENWAALQVQRVARGKFARNVRALMLKEAEVSYQRARYATEMAVIIAASYMRRWHARRVRKRWIRLRREWNLRRWKRSMFWPFIPRHNNASIKIQRHMRRIWAWRAALIEAAKMRRWWQERWAATDIQRVWRGRTIAFKWNSHVRRMNKAALDIQRVFRGSRVVFWRKQRHARYLQRLKDRLHAENGSAIEGKKVTVLRMRRRREKDDASSSDEERPTVAADVKVVAMPGARKSNTKGSAVETVRQGLEATYYAPPKVKTPEKPFDDKATTTDGTLILDHVQKLANHKHFQRLRTNVVEPVFNANAGSLRIENKSRDPKSRFAGRNQLDQLAFENAQNYHAHQQRIREMTDSVWLFEQRRAGIKQAQDEAKAAALAVAEADERATRAARRRASEIRRQYFELKDVDLYHLAFNNGIVGMRVRVYWPEEKSWYPARLTRFREVVDKYYIHHLKHRVDYDDGDHDWLVLRTEENRIQIDSRANRLVEALRRCKRGQWPPRDWSSGDPEVMTGFMASIENLMRDSKTDQVPDEDVPFWSMFKLVRPPRFLKDDDPDEPAEGAGDAATTAVEPPATVGVPVSFDDLIGTTGHVVATDAPKVNLKNAAFKVGKMALAVAKFGPGAKKSKDVTPTRAEAAPAEEATDAYAAPAPAESGLASPSWSSPQSSMGASMFNILAAAKASEPQAMYDEATIRSTLNLGAEWSRCWDDSGYCWYWFNEHTNMSVWETSFEAAVTKRKELAATQ